MAALRSRCGHYIFVLRFLLSSIFFLSSTNLRRHRLDVYHTSTHGVALVSACPYPWITGLSASEPPSGYTCGALDAGLKRAARGSLEMQDAKIAKNSPSAHLCTTLSGHVFATKACIDNRKKGVEEQYQLHMSSQYGELRPTNG